MTDEIEAGDIFKRSGQTRPELVRRFRKRVQMSKKWRDDEGYVKTWDRLRDLYRHKHFSGESNSDRIAVNISFSTVNTIAPAVSVNFPTVTVNPRDPEGADSASAVEAAVNYWFRHYNWRKEIKRTVRDSLITGHGWAKVWWKYEKGHPRPLTDEERSEQYDQAVTQAGDQAEQSPELAGELPTDEQLREQLPQTTRDVSADQPCVERVSQKDILIDPEATCPEDLSWIAQRIVRPLADVKKDAAFSKGARSKLKPDSGTNPRWRDNEDDNTSGKESYTDDIERVVLWEFYDLHNKFYCVFAESGGDTGNDQFLLDPTDLPYPYGHPFVYLGNYDVPDQFYDIGDLEALEPLQQELNAVRSDMRNHRKRYQRAYLGKKDNFTAAAINVIESDEDGRIAWIEDDVPLEGLIIPIPQVPLDAQMYSYSELIEDDINLVSGVSEYQRGSVAEIRRTATEAAMIQDASNARSADKLAEVEMFIQEIARRVVQLAQVYLTGDHAVQILGEDGAKSWVQFDNDAIQGEFDFLVEAGSTQPKDETFRQQRALEVANTLAPYVGVAVNPQALVSFVLREAFGIKDPSQFIMEIDPEAQDEQDQKLIETINYKDAPPDIQRQIEEAAGYTPSTLGGSSPVELGDNGVPAVMGGPEAPIEGEMPLEEDIPPELLAQLEGQVGLG